jgi:hypothetical protein
VLKFWRASLFALVTAQETVAIPTASSEWICGKNKYVN